VSSERRTSRRAFLAVCGLSAAAGVTAGAWKLIGGDDDDAHAVTVRVASGFTDLRSAQAVGRAYLEAHPGERDERRLVRQLRRSNGAWSRVSRPADVRRLGAAEARRDYAAGRLATVGGWYLSVTEVRLCALTTFA
jgi:hypothetical protein